MEKILPFPQIPLGSGMFPEERKPETYSITAETSAFNDLIASRISNIVTDYRLAATRNQKSQVLSRAVDICSQDYPHVYQQFGEYLIRCSMKGEESADLVAYTELTQVLSKEFEPPSNIRLLFLFEPHSVYSPDQKQHEHNLLKERLDSFFTKDGENIYFHETGGGSKKVNSLLKKAFTKFHSFTKAGIYIDTYMGTGSEPAEEELDFAFNDLDHVATYHPFIAYYLTVYDVLDSFLADGYKVSFLAEEGTLPHKPEPAPKNRVEYSLDEFKSIISQRARAEIPREIEIVKQLVSMIDDAPANTQTSILVILGSLHLTLLDKLPQRLLPISESKIVMEPGHKGSSVAFDKKYFEIYLKLKRGENVSDEEWNDLYASHIANRTRKPSSLLESIVLYSRFINYRP